MTERAENFNEPVADKIINIQETGKVLFQNLTKEDFIQRLPNQKPDVCVRADDGFIACGPIVGYSHPDSAPALPHLPHRPNPIIKNDTPNIRKSN
jgi:hypothetical protein